MDIKEISDRLELEKLVTDYATAVDTKQFSEFHNLFTRDALIDYTAVGGISGKSPRNNYLPRKRLRFFSKLSAFYF